MIVHIQPPPSEEEQLGSLATASAIKESGDYDKALELFREILQENPSITTETQAYVGIGEVHRLKGDYPLAERSYANATRLSPRNFEAQYGHGVVLQLMGRLVEAIKAFHRAVTIEPDNLDANRSMAAAYLANNEPQSAIPFAEKAVSLKPDDGPTRVNLGAAYEQVGRTSDAIRQYETAMELFEPSPELMMNLVNAYSKEQRVQETVNAAMTLIKVAPSANAYERLGWGYFKLGQFEASSNAYREAVALEPGHWVSLRGIGVNALNRWIQSDRTDVLAMQEARDAFRRSLQANPDQPKLLALMGTYGL